MSSTITTLRQQLQQLQALHEGGALDAEALARARAPLEERLAALEAAEGAMAAPTAMASPSPSPSVGAGAGAANPNESTAAAGTAGLPPPRPGRGLVAAMASVVLVLAVVGYAWTGSPRQAWLGDDGAEVLAAEAAAAAASAGDGSPPVTAAQMNQLVEQLAQRMKDRPDDPVGWAMLGRAYSALGRPAEAALAFKKALDLAGDNPHVLADYADALGTLAGGKLAGEPIALVKRALALDPAHLKAQALAGSAAFDEQDYANAVRYWEGVERALPPESPFLVQVRSSIAQARQLGGLTPAASAPAAGLGGTAVAAAPGTGSASATSSRPAPSSAAPASAVVMPGAPTATLPASGPSANATALTGRVSLAPALAAQAAPTDTVFVVARAVDGPRMPLAVLRRQVKDLPFDFRLDDSMAMTPDARLSGQPRVVVIARVSKSGNAMPQPGDLSGQSAPVAPGAAGVSVTIDQAQPR